MHFTSCPILFHTPILPHYPLPTSLLCSVTTTSRLGIWVHLSIFRCYTQVANLGVLLPEPPLCTLLPGVPCSVWTLLPRPSCSRSPSPMPAPHHLPGKADFHKGVHQVLLVAVKAKDLLDVVHHSIIHWGRDMPVTACQCPLYT